jgi:hypothetical protein
MKLYANASACAIWDQSAVGDAPFSAPLSYLPKIRFHSSLKYPAIIDTRSGISVSLPAVAANLSHQQNQIQLFAHGKAGIPYVEGKITSGLSREVGLCGSVPVQTCGTGAAGQFPRVVHLGADGAYVYLKWYGTTYELSGFSALTLTLTVYVTDVLLS